VLRVRLSKALLGELYTTEVENLDDQTLVGGQKELAEALEAVQGQSSATLSLSTAGAWALHDALDNCEDISNDGGYRALARAAGAKRDEIATMLKAPTQSNPGPTGALVGLGTLESLEVLSGGRVRKLGMRGRWLGWDTGNRRFAICRVVSNAGGRKLPTSVVKAHRRFHSEAPKTAVVADVPDPIGRLQQVGLVKALTYIVPRRINSPEKNPYRWHHAFGDTGHKGGNSYPERVMPALMRDARGNLFIKRRPGNIFRVDTWLRG
jgi:hypothetical protein